MTSGLVMKIAKGDGFGHAQAGAHDDALADLAPPALSCSASQTGCGQRGAGVEEHAHARQQVAAQRGVGLHRVGDRLEAGRHVEVDRGRDLAQVAQRLGHAARASACRRRCRACRRCRCIEADVVVAAEGVVPGQPVHQHRRLLGQHRHRLAHLLLVGAPHAVRVDHRLGQLGRAGGEEELGDGVRAGGLHRGVDGRRGLASRAGRANGVAVRPSSVPSASTTSTSRRHGRGDGACRSARRRRRRPGRASACPARGAACRSPGSPVE